MAAVTDNSKDNKKLTRTLMFTGASIIIILIIVRLSFRQNQLDIVDAPTINELNYDPIKLPENETNEQKLLAQAKKENDEIKYGGSKEQYVSSNFNSFFTVDTTKNVVQNNTAVTAPQNNNTGYVSTPSNTGNKKNNVVDNEQGYTSAYVEKYKPKPTVENPQPVYTEVKQPEKTPSSPFGTMKKAATTNVKAGNTSAFKGIKSEIYGDQKITNAGPVRIRNKAAFTAQGIEIPANSILKGQASYSGNRVTIKLNKAETSKGSFTIDVYVLDNDNIEGIAYKAVVDEVKENTEDQTNINIGGKYGKLASTLTNTAIKAGKDLNNKSRALELEDGYIVYLIPNEKAK